MSKKGSKKEIDWELVERLAHIQCTVSEITSVLGVSLDTLRKRCVEHYGCPLKEKVLEWAEGGKASLRRAQWRMAQTKPVMAIWLGKQLLGQSESVQVNHQTNPVQIVHYGDKSPSKWLESSDSQAEEKVIDV